MSKNPALPKFVSASALDLATTLGSFPASAQSAGLE